MSLNDGGIAFFDSGIGGLTLLHTCVCNIPNQLFYYYGDNKNAPYGNLPAEEIYSLTMRVFDRFHVLQVKAAVIACNTVTAVCADFLRVRYPFPIIGTEPALRPACLLGGEVLVLATKATCQSEKFLRLKERCLREFPSANIVIHPCEGLAGAIERSAPKLDFDIFIHIPTTKPDVVVLGCTHYIYIKERLKSYYKCPILDGHLGISTKLSTHLLEENKADLSTKSQPFIHKLQKSRDEKPLASTDGILHENGSKIIFLGANSRRNQSIYEQMFGKLEK